MEYITKYVGDLRRYFYFRSEIIQEQVTCCIFLDFFLNLLLTQIATLQAERVRDAAWGCDWVGTPLPFMRCLSFIINLANKEFVLTAGKFVPVSKATMMNVRSCVPIL
jgi:hypothetical protein